MSTDAYRKLWSQVQHLSSEEQLQLLVDLTNLLKRPLAAKPLYSILELEGLGKEIWESIKVLITRDCRQASLEDGWKSDNRKGLSLRELSIRSS